METMIKEIIEDLMSGYEPMIANIISGQIYNPIDSEETHQSSITGDWTNTKISDLYVYVDCNSTEKYSIHIAIPFSTISETECFETEIENLQETITEELEFWTETNSLNRGSLKNLSIELVRNFFLEGFDIDLYNKEFIKSCEWKSMYRD